MLKTICNLAFGLGAGALLATGASAAIIGAVGATINAGGPGFGSISDTFDQSGLSATYTPGVTDFDTFVAATTHDYAFDGNEWWSEYGLTSASVTYDLGASMTIDKMALWNEDAVGIGLLDLLVSSDGVTFSALLSGLTPTENLINVDYGADVFAFGPTNFRYIRLDMARCAAAQEWPQDACAIGEVAFNTSEVPIPGAILLLLTGVGSIGLASRRRKA